MRVVILHRGFRARGGAEVLALAQARDLVRAGVDVKIVTFEFDPAGWEGALEDIPVRVVPRHHWSDLAFLLDRGAALVHRSHRVESVLRELAPDVVLAHNHPAPAILGACALNARKLWYCHEPPRCLYPRLTNRFLSEASQAGLLVSQPPLAQAFRRNQREGRFWRRGVDFDQRGISGLDGIAANSSYTRVSVANTYGGLRAEVHYPAVALEPAPHRPGLDRRGLQILVQTRLELMKNVDTVLRGFRIARRHLGGAPRLHVVGRGEELPALEALARELDIDDAVTFHGFLPDGDLRRLRQNCDVFAFLPWDEPFGMVFPEAAAAGLLLIGPDHGGPWEILGGGQFGWCVPPHAPVALAEALCKVWELDEGVVQRRRKEALDACAERFDANVVLPKFRRWVGL